MMRKIRELFRYRRYLLFITLALVTACASDVKTPLNEYPIWQGKKEIVLHELLKVGADNLDEADQVFGGIFDFAFDNENNIYVLDFVNFRVSKFGYDGHFIAHFGKGKGQGPGEFQYPTGVCVDPQNNVYVADFKQRAIHVFNESNEEIKVIHTEDNIRPVFGMVISSDLELFAGVDLTFSTWRRGLFQIFSLPAGKYAGSLADCGWFINHRNVMSGNNCIALDESRGLVIVSHANPYRIDIFSKRRELIRSFGRSAEFFDSYFLDSNKNRIMGGTTTNLAYLPSGIIINVVKHLTKTTAGSQTKRYFDFFNIEGDYLLTALDKEFGVEGPYYLVFKSDLQGNLWISHNEPYPHLAKLSIQFRDKQ